MRDITAILRSFIKLVEKIKTHRYSENDWLDYLDYMDLVNSFVKNRNWEITIGDSKIEGRGFQTLTDYIRNNYGPLQNDKMRFEVTDK